MKNLDHQNDMGVLAAKIISGTSVKRNWECGTFDLMTATNPSSGWVELSRDCDAWPQSRWTLYPYASGNNGAGQFSPPIGNIQIEFAKYFPIDDDTQLTELDMSDINGGVLPGNPASIAVYQNGKKLPSIGYTIDFTLSLIELVTEWQVPGSSYEVVFSSY